MMSIREILNRYKVHGIIWFYAVTEKYYEQPFRVAVVPINVHPEYVIANDYTKSVTVLFRGKGRTLLLLMKQRIEVPADLKQSTRPFTVVQLSLEKIRVPTSFMELEPLKFVDKDTIEFRLERLTRRRVPVHGRIRVVPKSGYTVVGDLEIKPAHVLISGPESMVLGVDSLETEFVEVDSAVSDVVGDAALINPRPEKLQLEVQSVHYRVLVQRLGEKTLEGVPVRVINVPVGRRARVRPPTLAVHLIGGRDFLAKIGPKDITAYVDYRRYLQTGETLLPANIEVPDHLRFDEVKPRRFRLIVE